MPSVLPGEEGPPSTSVPVPDCDACPPPSTTCCQDQIQKESAAVDPIIPATSTIILQASPDLSLRCKYECNEKANLTDEGKQLHNDGCASSTRTVSEETLPEFQSSSLPPGCTWGPKLTPDLLNALKLDPSHYPSTTSSVGTSVGSSETVPRIIWVSFLPNSPHNPFFFSRTRKLGITAVATCFTLLTSVNVSAYSIGETSMCRDLGISAETAAVGLGIYCFGFAITPMILAPLSEEFGRRWTYVAAVFIFFVFHIMMAAAKNLATMLIARIIQGCAGSVGSTLVGGTIADIYIPVQRGLPSAVFAFAAIAGSGMGPVIFAWVESTTRLEWRWIWWIQSMTIGALFPFILLIMRETRESVILRRRAAKLRKEHQPGEKNEKADQNLFQAPDGVVGRFTAWSEMNRIGLWEAMRTSALRPFTFLVVEPVVAFFALWMSIAWGVLYIQIGGLPYVFRNIYAFSTNQVGLIYLSLVIGALIGFFANFVQDAIYRRRVHLDGVEARLYAPMVAGITFALGCFLFGFTSLQSIYWLVPCIGIVIIIASCLTIYISAFVYLSECYGSYASSAIAGQSFLRNAFGGAFSMFTVKMYTAITPRWTIFTWGVVALILAMVPFIAFYKGTVIRAHSKYSKILMREERERIEREKEKIEDREGERSI
ncbi:drug transporter [Cryptococcus neoformans C23]|uniref:Drug transporter n=1 Tax=Cryptococcus neoformans (strain H99 / ATCC 208821 / CBS 10515 / FGSC 9487) TaxID=235443 RepID=J9W0R7_CRYN9|nr:drug transporter [Cryptococcus neoformans var. grubii H99]AUB27693.1 drug transporter [Cryptococcus neoformans var. grubii]OWZ28254.1 drug transporter [Cryptococcus neoformans var. grubii AD2-60a]OWZ40569.1 drug transporter [Cryptococcus neoformans var. grubii C23]OWZ51471.1 drug transporter [Cryptococcus neoformans var. grubii 125.91]OXC82383.1 drug transporter [Cryptococcus neoformans var. grubii AD1-7a]|eukprot:XP_012052048.1 drug transporter [Cryptococcus neoformans var. grubii H99]